MGDKLYRKDFVYKVYNKLKESGHFVPWETVYWTNAAFVDALVDVIENGDTLYVWDVFTLKPKVVQEHRVGNFGEPMIIPQHYTAYFESKGRLKEACEKFGKKEQETKDEEES